MRSFDRAMPEELNRVLTDHLATLLLCPRRRPRRTCAREARRRAAIEVVGDVMVDVALRWQPSARADDAALAALRRRAGRLPAADGAPRRQRRRPGAPARARRADRRRCPGPVAASRCTRARARACSTRGLLERRSPSVDGVRLDRAARLRRVQRAALPGARGRSPTPAASRRRRTLPACPASRCAPSTEWVETVEAGWNTLVDLDRERRAARARSARRRASTRSSTATATRPSAACRRSASCDAARAPGRAAMSDERAGARRRRRPRLLGAEPRAQPRGDPRLRAAWLCDGVRGGAREAARASFPQARRRATSSDLLADDELDAVVLATPVPTHAELAIAVLRARQALLRGEAARDRRAADAEARRRGGRAARPDADGRAPARVPPGGRAPEGAGRRRRARRRSTTCTATA